MPFPLRLQGLLVVPFISAVVVAGTVTAGAVGVGQAPARADLVAKTTIGVISTPVPPPSTALPTTPTPPSTGPPLTAATVVASIVTLPSPTDPAVSTTEPSGLSPASVAAALPLFGLDAAKLQCLASALPSFSADDNTALAGLQGCGVALMPLLRGVVDLSQRSNSFLEPTATTVPLPTPPGAAILPPEDAFYIGFLLLIVPEETQCLAAGVAAAPSEDDATALSIMQGCAVPLGRTLDMLLFALESDVASDPTAATLPVVTALAPTVPAATTGPAPATTLAAISPDDPLVDDFQQTLLEQEGITLDDQQAACLLNQINAGAIDMADTTDMSAMLVVLEACGVTLSDLLPGGTPTTLALRT